MSIAWPDLVTAVGALFEVQITNAASATPSSDPNFNTIFPRAIEQAEQRIYRELDLITTETAETAPLTSGLRNVAIPAGLLILHELNIVTPAGATPDAGRATPVSASRLPS